MDISTALKGGLRVQHPELTMSAPLLTVLIVVFRDRAELSKIIESLLPHKSPNLEIIVVDGGSKDGTVELLEGLGDLVDYWISEPDQGIYDAMNKGLAVARGTYILHLNAGDTLLELPWNDLSECAAAAIDVVCCRVLLDGRKEFIPQTSLLSKIDNTWHHQGTFYLRKTHLGYNTKYRNLSDFDHNQRLLKNRSSIREFSTVVANHNLDGITSTTPGYKETYRIVRANFGWVYVQLSRIRFFLRSIRNWMRERVK